MSARPDPAYRLTGVSEILGAEVERQRVEGGPFDDTSVIVDEYLKLEACPECGHSDQNHDENGCDVDGCECLGP